MKRLIAAFVITVAFASPAAAYVPNDPDRPSARLSAAPTPAPASPVQMPGDRAQEPLPLDLYRVTDVYVAAVVTRSGDLTTYSTATRHEDTDTYARVLDRVGTGASSVYDGAAFNGRAVLSDGQAVAGTYYQNYVFDGAAYRPVSIVFFQDDSELARRRAAPTPAAIAMPGRIPARPPQLDPAASSRPVPQSPAPLPLPTLGPLPIGVDPTGGVAVLDRIEVARGARYSLRVNVRGAASLLAWSLVAGYDDAVNPAGWHAATEALEGQWLRLPSPAQPWNLTVRVRVRAASGVVEREGTIAVWVRSPAVVE